MKMSPYENPRPHRGRLIAALIALAALGTVAVVWFWTSLISTPVPLLSWQNGVIVGGGLVCCLAGLIALGLEEILEWIWAIVAAIAAIIVAAFWGVLSLFGWN